MNGYRVTVSGPDGDRVILLSAEQVEFFKVDTNGDPYQAALWLAYCDAWAAGVRETA